MADKLAWPLIGHGAAETAFVDAKHGGKLHHGWLVSGPSGIGKARFAMRMAASLLGAETAPKTLDAPRDDSIIQKIEADAHPDLRWICRRPDEKGKLRQDIPVDAIRELNAFFALKPALGGWRVGVIDSLDELNRSGANALLKTLEEPPANCLLVLISHNTRPVLPTIRSRCRTVQLHCLDEADTERVFAQLETETGDQISAGAKLLARGRPGHGLKLASSTGLAAANAARAYLKGLPTPSDATLADALLKCGVDETAYAAFGDEVLAWLAEMAQEKTEYASTWLEAARALADAQDLNMDRQQSAAKLLAGLQKTKRTA
ncbi:MAG: DNA polymerase III subunit delta' [Pseudomonadota bacterium]